MRLILSVLLVLEIAGVGIPQAATACRGSGYRDYYRNGVQARDFKRWPEVVDCMRAALRENGRENRERIEISGAREERYLPYFHLGWALAELDQPEAAREALRASVEQGVSRGDSRWDDLQERLDQIETAVAEIRLEEVSAMRQQVATEMEGGGTSPEARRSYEEAVAKLGAARLLVAQGEPVPAQETVEAAAAEFRRTSAEIRRRAPREAEAAPASISARVVQAAAAYAELDYELVVRLLEGERLTAPRDRFNAHLLLGASIHALIRRGLTEGRSLADVREHVRECLAIQPDFRPSPSDYPPEFVALFE